MKMWDSSVGMDPKGLHVMEVFIVLNMTEEIFSLLFLQQHNQPITQCANDNPGNLNCETEVIPIQLEVPNKMKFHPELTGIH